jgi:hypothetical protein
LITFGKNTSSDFCSSCRARARSAAPSGHRAKGWRVAVFEVLEDLRRVEQLDVAVDQHRHLLLDRVDAQHVGVLGLVGVAG